MQHLPGEPHYDIRSLRDRPLPTASSRLVSDIRASLRHRCKVLASFLLACTLVQQSSAQDTSKVNSGRLALVGGLTLGTAVPVHIYQRNAWWQGPRAPFRFQNDWLYAFNVDKLGHLYGAYLLSRVYGYTFRWCGLSRSSSALYGSLLGITYQMYVEIEDGFHENYGFSPGDAMFNMVGAFFPTAQETFPVLQNFSLKYSYFPSKKYLDEIQQGQKRAFIDDYQGMTVWLAIDPHFMMGAELANAIPSWLGISLGLGARDLNGLGGGTRVIYLTVDYNFSKIETDSDFLRGLFTTLDFLHFPAPGIALHGNSVRVGFFYP